MGEGGVTLAQRMIEFDAHSILQLLTHYTQDHDDRIPLDAELLNAGFSQFINRWIMLEAQSEHEWRDIPVDPRTGELKPLHFRYEGKHTLSWGGSGESADAWLPAVDSPTN